jgi:hypothetical protein
MVININEDREIRLIWAKFQNVLNQHKRFCVRNALWKEHNMDDWDRIRDELEAEMHAQITQVRKRYRLEKRERKRLENENKPPIETTPPYIRRSKRIQEKNEK